MISALRNVKSTFADTKAVVRVFVCGFVISLVSISGIAAVLHMMNEYVVFSVKTQNGAAVVPALAVHSTGFDPAKLSEADQQRWLDLEREIDGRYPMLKTRGRARILVRYSNLARKAGLRFHDEQWFAFPDGTVIFNLLLYGRTRSCWEVTDDVSGTSIRVIRSYLFSKGWTLAHETGTVECPYGSPIQISASSSTEAQDKLGHALAQCWSRIKDGPRRRLGRALTMMQSLYSRNMAGKNQVDSLKKGLLFTLPIPDMASALGLGKCPRIHVEIAFGPRDPSEALEPVDEEVAKRFCGTSGWRPIDLTVPFDQAVSALP
ncbi:MAG: hypothetical protein GXP48_11225 [Acidobacteria bacterium]|nr:hypothetical protein [Acidobacteriota bacterium]